jgi:4-amino-4-deoxy-L-arabinose transferase-like glycosyltransferase
MKRVVRPDDVILDGAPPPTRELASIRRIPSVRAVSGARGYDIATSVIVLMASALQVAQYLYDRSLWMDEAFLSINLLDQPFSRLFGQLGFNQAAPPGFLVTERVAITILGTSEYALRLFPLLCGIASIFLFKRMSRLLLDRTAALLALALFGLSDALIYYSSEVKQYSTDVAITLLIGVGGLDLLSRRPSRRRLVVWCVIGAAAVWFSHAAAFAVGAVITLFAFDVLRRRWDVVKPTSVVLGIWLLSLGVALAFERNTAAHVLHSYTGTNSIGLGATTGSSGSTFPTGLQFFRDAAGGLFEDLGIQTTGPGHDGRWIIAAVGLLGAGAMARRALDKFAFLATPAVGVFAASAIGGYPVLPRTILFLVPTVALFVARGAVALAAPFRTHRRAVTLGIAAALLAVPAVTAVRHAVEPRQREEMKPVLSYLASQWRPGDSLFLFRRAQYAVRYYLECDCLLSSSARGRVFGPVATPRRIGGEQYAPALLSEPPRMVVARPEDTLREYLQPLKPLLGRKRVWLLATAADPVERSLFDYLSCVGRRRDGYLRRTGGGDFHSVVLARYDLSSWRSLVDEQCGARLGL